MRKWLCICACLCAICLLFGCNKQKAHKLDYAKKGQEREYSATGLPGDNYVGAPESATKFTESVSDTDDTDGKDEKKPGPDSKSEEKEGRDEN